MDLQAQDRVHRIGQTKPVLIFRLSTANTAEGRMLASAASKRRLERLVIHKKKFKGRQQLLAADESLLAEDLAEILGEGRKEQSLVEGEERDELTRAELKALLDRSDAAFERHWDTSTIKTNK
jgi:ATP-dependent DNA helicase